MLYARPDSGEYKVSMAVHTRLLLNSRKPAVTLRSCTATSRLAMFPSHRTKHQHSAAFCGLQIAFFVVLTTRNLISLV